MTSPLHHVILLAIGIATKETIASFSASTLISCNPSRRRGHTLLQLMSALDPKIQQSHWSHKMVSLVT